MNKDRLNKSSDGGKAPMIRNGTNTNNAQKTGTRTTNFDNLDKDALFTKIQELRFVKAELELYLDTHPGCRVALDYYYQTIDALRDLYERYSAYGAPLFASEVQGDTWSWVDNPWPWHRHGGIDGRGEE
ncbi:MAG: spore coat protein CotJB [Clostridia bacterium]|nr:spore coat protein CotJB [Clostridia bacterium]